LPAEGTECWRRNRCSLVVVVVVVVAVAVAVAVVVVAVVVVVVVCRQSGENRDQTDSSG